MRCLEMLSSCRPQDCKTDKPQILCLRISVSGVRSELRGKMETDFWEIGLCHLEDIVTVSQKYVASFLVLCHEVLLALFEGCERLFVIALNPACLVKTYWLPSALGPVLMQKPVLDHLELELADGADDFTAIELVGEYLRHSLVHQLADAFVKLFLLHRVGVFDILEHLGREAWQSSEVKLFAAGQGVADLEIACVRYAYDITGICFVDHAVFLGHEGCRCREAHHLVVADVAEIDVPLEFAGAYVR